VQELEEQGLGSQHAALMWSFAKDYEYDHFGRDYNNDEEQEDIAFYRPDRSIEGKSIHWCVTNGFFKVEEDLWSGDWYYRHFPEKLLEKEQRTCPVRGCSKVFSTSAFADKHVRTCHFKTHRNYRNEHGIRFGLTPKEIEEERLAEQEREEMRIAIERNELYEVLNDCSKSEAKQARQRLQDLDERNCKLGCIVKGCRRRFEIASDLEMHLMLSMGKAHQKALVEFDMNIYECSLVPSQTRITDFFTKKNSS